MDINNMTDAELNEALKSELAEDDSTTTSEEELEANDFQEEPQEKPTAEEEVEEQPQIEDKPKGKSNIKKILSEKNYWKQKAKELEERVGIDKETDLEYINATAAKVAAEMIEEREFFKDNPDAIEIKDILKGEDYAGLDLNRAWKLYQAEHNPEDLVIKQNKANAKKYDTTGYSSPKLKTDRPVNELSLDELRARLAQELKAGRVEI